VQFKWANLTVCVKKKIKQPDAFCWLVPYKIINSITPARVGLIFVKKLVMAFGAGPHGESLFISTNLRIIENNSICLHIKQACAYRKQVSAFT
jgi:hypothetical protein